ncbi:MAG: Spy/CpxP family protein refolding chaperone [Deltaproteobacteria bacterium]|nr:MAG: Spy/CpxP family protein refolding chaperone [Deltaproteobacteria bacterium]
MKFNKALVGVLFLTIVFAGAVAVRADHFGRHHRPHGMTWTGLHGLKTMIQLNLSDAQKSKILSIIEKYENEREGLKRSLREARENCARELETEPFNEAEVRNALRQTAPIKEELLVMRLKMMAELNTVLTPEQNQLLKELRPRRIERLKAREHMARRRQ